MEYEYKSNKLDKNSCYNFEENTTIVPKTFKNEKPNDQCNKYIPDLGFEKSSKRITNEDW